MQIKLTWKKNFFSNSFRLYLDGRQIGKLKEKMFSQTAEGQLHGKEFTFKTKGFIKQHAEIVDSLENKVIGEITYNNWMTKAIILVDNKTMNWKYDNFWNTKWSIYNSEGIKIQYSGSSNSGQIDSNIDDALYVLCGLFVTNYYWQSTAAIIIALIPIWTIILR